MEFNQNIPSLQITYNQIEKGANHRMGTANLRIFVEVTCYQNVVYGGDTELISSTADKTDNLDRIVNC